MKKPKKCCNMGDHTHTVPMPIGGRSVDIDFCIADIVAALNAANIKTIASCCGHNKQSASIVLDDGRSMTLTNPSRLGVSSVNNGREGTTTP